MGYGCPTPTYLERAVSTTPTSAVVVGAGIIGCSIALELSRRGWDVTVVDKGSTPGCGSTSASSAMVRFNYDNLQEAVLAWESYARWVEWSKHLGVEDPAGLATYVRTGLLGARRRAARIAPWSWATWTLSGFPTSR